MQQFAKRSGDSFVATVLENNESSLLVQPEASKNTDQVVDPHEMRRAELYVEVLKAAFQEENGCNSFIAVKLDTLEGLSEQSKKQASTELSSLSSNVYDYEDVKNDETKFEFDKDGMAIRTRDGALLWINLDE